MKTYKIRTNPLLIIFTSLLLFAGCSKKSPQSPEVTPTPSNPPSITGISVSSGGYGTLVDIKGANFSTASADDKIFFNGKAAVVTFVSSNKITAAVPVGAGTGDITATIKGVSITGPLFTYTLTAEVSTLAGNGISGFDNGIGTQAFFASPVSLIADKSGNVYVAEAARIRKIDTGAAVSYVAGNGSSGVLVNGPGNQAIFNGPRGIAIDAAGNLYIADYFNNVIRKIAPDKTVSTFAGTGAVGSSDGPANAATFNYPSGVAVDAGGNIYVVDQQNHRIRKIDPSGNVSTLAGSSQGYKNGTGTDAQFNTPNGIAVDAAGNLYIAEVGNYMIRKISPSGVVTTLAGSGSMGDSNGKGTDASFAYPTDVAVDAAGNVYVADQVNDKIRKIDQQGMVSDLAGSGLQGFDNGQAAHATFFLPDGIATDSKGNIYVADTDNNAIRKITFK